MQKQPHPMAFALLLASTTMAAQEEAPAASVATLGESVSDHEFVSIDWHDGRTRLSQLHGHPVLVVGWRQYIPEPSGLHAAWFAHSLLGEFGEDGLIVILEDRTRWHDGRWWQARSFWIRMFEHQPVWFADGRPEEVADLPIQREESARDDRSAVLIGVDGTLIFEGTIEDAGENALGKKVRKLVKAELERRKKGWGEDRDLKKARGLAFGGGKYAAALAAVEKSKAPEADRDGVRDEIGRALESDLVSVRFLLDRGRYLEAEELFEALQKGCRGDDALLARLEPLEPEFGDKETLELARSVDKLLDPMSFEDWNKFDFDELFALRELAASHPDHAIGKRAARLDPLVKDLVRISKGLMPKAMEAEIERREEKDSRR